MNYKDRRTEGHVALAAKAYRGGAFERSLALLAEADGYEAWSYADSGSESRQAIAATIAMVRKAQRATTTS